MVLLKIYIWENYNPQIHKVDFNKYNLWDEYFQNGKYSPLDLPLKSKTLLKFLTNNTHLFRTKCKFADL